MAEILPELHDDPGSAEEPPNHQEIISDGIASDTQVKHEACVDESKVLNTHEADVKNNMCDEERTNVKASSQPNEVSEERNPFAYLERDNFTAEKFKLMIRNLPKYYGINVSLHMAYSTF